MNEEGKNGGNARDYAQEMKAKIVKIEKRKTEEREKHLENIEKEGEQFKLYQQEKMVKCIYCKNYIPQGVDNCPYCLDERIKSTSKTGGFALGILGGTISILIGSLILVLYPEFLILGMLFVTIFQFITILGGVITVIGTIIFLRFETSKTAKIAWITVLIGGILGGGNLLSIFVAQKYLKSYFNLLR
ncbi:MAG: hypothetical protein ACFE94_05140 [Candidatus Hodarchaeota archaeon]